MANKALELIGDKRCGFDMITEIESLLSLRKGNVVTDGLAESYALRIR